MVSFMIITQVDFFYPACLRNGVVTSHIRKIVYVDECEFHVWSTCKGKTFCFDLFIEYFT